MTVAGNHTFCQTVVGNHIFCHDGSGKSYIVRRSWEIIYSVMTVAGNHTFCQTVVGNHTFCQDGRGKSYILSRRSWEIIQSVRRSWEIIQSVNSTILCHCMTYFSNTARHLLVASFKTSLNSNSHTSLNIPNTTDSNWIISHAQNTIALQPNVFLTGINGSLVTTKGRSPFSSANHCQGHVQTPESLHVVSVK